MSPSTWRSLILKHNHSGSTYVIPFSQNTGWWLVVYGAACSSSGVRVGDAWGPRAQWPAEGRAHPVPGGAGGPAEGQGWGGLRPSALNGCLNSIQQHVTQCRDSDWTNGKPKCAFAFHCMDGIFFLATFLSVCDVKGIWSINYERERDRGQWQREGQKVMRCWCLASANQLFIGPWHCAALKGLGLDLCFEGKKLSQITAHRMLGSLAEWRVNLMLM